VPALELSSGGAELQLDDIPVSVSEVERPARQHGACVRQQQAHGSVARPPQRGEARDTDADASLPRREDARDAAEPQVRERAADRPVEGVEGEVVGPRGYAVDLVALAVVHHHRPVAADVDPVAAGSAFDVVAVLGAAAGQLVVSASALEEVAAGSPVQGVVAVPAEEPVGARSADQPVASAVPDQGDPVARVVRGR
jgi:hypothetical protein